jgi:hypothetical protein
METPSNNMMQLNKTIHWEIAKLLELGVNEEWLKDQDPTPEQIKDLLKGLLYIREWYKDMNSKDEGYVKR